MLQVSLKNNLPDLVKRTLCSIDLNQNILAWDIFVDHFLNCIQLSDHFSEAQMQFFRFHTLFHNPYSRDIR